MNEQPKERRGLSWSARRSWWWLLVVSISCGAGCRSNGLRDEYRRVNVAEAAASTGAIVPPILFEFVQDESPAAELPQRLGWQQVRGAANRPTAVWRSLDEATAFPASDRPGDMAEIWIGSIDGAFQKND